MELENFVSRNFKPRDDFEELAKELIREELKRLPAAGQVKAVVTDMGDSFNISMVAKANNKIFNSESNHTKEKLRGAPRMWQLEAIRIVLNDLVRQIKKSLRLPDIKP